MMSDTPFLNLQLPNKSNSVTPADDTGHRQRQNRGQQQVLPAGFQGVIS